MAIRSRKFVRRWPEAPAAPPPRRLSPGGPGSPPLGQRRLQPSALTREYTAICNWLAESDDISDFAWLAHEYRRRIGIDAFPDTAEDYLRALLDIARRTFGTP